MAPLEICHTTMYSTFNSRYTVIILTSLIRRYIIEVDIRGSFEKFVDWRQCAAVVQKEAVTVMPNCSGGGKLVVT
jgi:hypothetical protein